MENYHQTPRRRQKKEMIDVRKIVLLDSFVDRKC